MLLLAGLLSSLIYCCKKGTRCGKCKALFLKIFIAAKAKLIFSVPMRTSIISYLSISLTADPGRLFFGDHFGQNVLEIEKDKTSSTVRYAMMAGLLILIIGVIVFAVRIDP